MLSEILNKIEKLDNDQLQQLNHAVVRRLKINRDHDAVIKRQTLCEGDRVSWAGRQGRQEGTIVRIKRKKAICDIGAGRNWDVPLSMLTAI